MKRLLCLLSVLLVANNYQVYARVHEAKNEDRLYRALERSNLAIVLFYQESRSWRHEHTEQARLMTRLLHMFHRASESILFEEGGLIFVRANGTRSEIAHAAESFGVSQMPAFILFVDGEGLKTADHKPLVLTGFVPERRLIAFINQYLRDYLEKNRKIYRRRQEVRALTAPNVSVGIGFGFPCGGWGYCDPYDYEPYYYYDRPSWGFGVGVGGPCW